MTETNAARREWLIPTGLILLSLVPVLAGAARVTELSSGPAVTAENARFVAAPIPVVVHIVAATIYCLLGAFQFVPGLRRRRIGWHRAAGRLLVPCGLAAALAGLWMAAFYARPPGDGAALTVLRFIFGSAMIACIALGFLAVRRGDITRHRAFMMRGYAIGLGAGTQLFTHLPWVLFLGPPSVGVRTVLMGAGWVINIVVAEWFIRRRVAGPARTAAVVSPSELAR
jgi:uncharacterized membrane protein